MEQWYLDVSGNPTGPFTTDQIEGLVRDGEIPPEVEAFREGAPDDRIPAHLVSSDGPIISEPQIHHPAPPISADDFPVQDFSTGSSLEDSFDADLDADLGDELSDKLGDEGVEDGAENRAEATPTFAPDPDESHFFPLEAADDSMGEDLEIPDDVESPLSASSEIAPSHERTESMAPTKNEEMPLTEPEFEPPPEIEFAEQTENHSAIDEIEQAEIPHASEALPPLAPKKEPLALEAKAPSPVEIPVATEPAPAPAVSVAPEKVEKIEEKTDSAPEKDEKKKFVIQRQPEKKNPHPRRQIGQPFVPPPRPPELEPKVNEPSTPQVSTPPAGHPEYAEESATTSGLLSTLQTAQGQNNRALQNEPETEAPPKGIDLSEWTQGPKLWALVGIAAAAVAIIFTSTLLIFDSSTGTTKKGTVNSAPADSLVKAKEQKNLPPPVRPATPRPAKAAAITPPPKRVTPPAPVRRRSTVKPIRPRAPRRARNARRVTPTRRNNDSRAAAARDREDNRDRDELLDERRLDGDDELPPPAPDEFPEEVPPPEDDFDAADEELGDDY